jgi:hypothetical protein
LNRQRLANAIREARKEHFKSWNSLKQRRFDYLKEESRGFDLKEFLKRIIKRKGFISVLHSGAGYLALDSQIKRHFRGHVFIGSLNVIHPYSWPQTRKRVFRQAKLMAQENKVQSSGLRREAQYQNDLHIAKEAKRIRDLTSQKANIPDEIIVGSAERFIPKRKYDVILDLFSPLHYSPFQSEVMEKYLEALTRDGTIVVFMSNPKEFKKQYCRKYTINENGAQRTYLVTATYAKGGNVLLLKKKIAKDPPQKP